MTLMELVSLQLLLYAPLWLLASRVFRDEQRAVWHWFGYALTSAVAMMLLASRVSGVNWWNTTGAGLCVLLNVILARRGVELFLHLRPRDIEFAMILAFAWLGLTAAGQAPEQAWQRDALTSGFSVVLLGATLRCWRALAREFSARLAIAASLPVLALMFVHLLQVVLAWRNPEALTTSAADPSLIPSGTWVVVLVSAAAFNYLFLFLVALRLVNKLSHQARHDPLTGLLNRRAMNHVLAAEWARYQQGDTTFALVSLDIDHFKRVNDQYGHAAGDEVLRGVATRLQGPLRPVDRLARVGGEELLVLLPGCAAADAGRLMAERLRAALADSPVAISPSVTLPVAASLGVAGPEAADSTIEQVMARADAAMYRAKEQGRDRVIVG